MAWADGRPQKHVATDPAGQTARWVQHLYELGYRPPQYQATVPETAIGALDRAAAAQLVLSRLASQRSRWNAADVRGEVERLIASGQARGEEGIEDLWRALKLVQGPPFANLPKVRRGAPGGYLWLTESASRLDHEYPAMITDTAHIAATFHLGAGEPARAAEAARVALLAGSYEDVPLLDLVRANLELGDEAEATSFIQQILANHDAEIEEDLPPTTAEILLRLQNRWSERAV